MRRLRYYFATLGCLLTLSSCGEADTYIADKVKFKVIFSSAMVQVSFQMNSKFQVAESVSQPFDPLGLVFLKWNQDLKFNEVGARFKANLVNQMWPVTILNRFPNGERLPGYIRGLNLNWWLQPHGDYPMGLVYYNQSILVGGGTISSSRLSFLPKNFLGTQHFRSVNGEVEATVSALGPTDTELGGIYFFANFGANPFRPDYQSSKPQDPRNLFDGADHPDVVEWEISATEPLQIIRRGR